MTKSDLVAAIAEQTGCTKKDCDAVLKAFTETVTKELKNGGSVQLIGFGTFKTTKRSAREGVNPQTGKKIKIAAKTAPKFTAGAALKDAVK